MSNSVGLHFMACNVVEVLKYLTPALWYLCHGVIGWNTHISLKFILVDCSRTKIEFELPVYLICNFTW